MRLRSSRALRWLAAAVTLVMVLAAVLPAFGQATPTATATPNPQAQITFPPPVYVLRGQFPVLGTANLPSQTNFFIEFRPVDGALSGGSGQIVFFPAILPRTQPVTNGLLGQWDTTLVPDGLYELRLTVNVQGGDPVTQVISPLRVENNPPPEVEELLGIGGGTTGGAGTVPTLAPVQPVQPTAVPATLAPTDDPTPRVTATQNANVRSGDGVNFPIVGSLSSGQSAPILGISALGTGWYQVRLANGTVGWMSPSVVTTSGNLSGVPRVQPPPPPATPTPTPIPATATPTSNINLVAGNASFSPGNPTCNQPFTVLFDVANFGTQVSPGGIVRAVNARLLDGQLPQTVEVAFPPINPGQTITVSIPFTVSVFFNEVHRMTLTIDPNNVIPETTKADNVRTLDYTLAQGSCG